MEARTARLNTIEAALEQAAEQFRQARESYDAAQIRYELARSNLAAARAMAKGIMTEEELEAWRHKNQFIRYAGLPIGQAVLEALIDRAGEAYARVMNNSEPVNPALSIEEIERRLEIGGFDFLSGTPGREVNAAIQSFMRSAEPVIKKNDDGRYQFFMPDDGQEAKDEAKE